MQKMLLESAVSIKMLAAIGYPQAQVMLGGPPVHGVTGPVTTVVWYQ